MVFKTRSLSTEPTSAAKAELQQNVVDLIPRLASVAKCTNCKVDGDTIYFGENGVFELDVTPFLPSRDSLLSLVVDESRAPVGLSVDYEIALTESPFEGTTDTTLFRGALATLPPNDTARRYAYRLIAPVTGGTILRLSASNAALPLKYLTLVPYNNNTNLSIVLPFPRVVHGDVLSMWRLPIQLQQYRVHFFWNSENGNTATVTYREDGVDIASFSTTSRTTVTNSVSRVWRRDVRFSFSASSNAVVKVLRIDFLVWPPVIPVRTLRAYYSTPGWRDLLNLSATYARIRRIVVAASSNAMWHVNVGDSRVLDSLDGISSIDFNPPVEATRVSISLTSRDWASPTASVVVIYDEVPGRL